MIRVQRQPGARRRHRQATRPASWWARCRRTISRSTTTASQQEIAVFEHQTDQPLSVALLLDTSGSTAKEFKYEADSAVKIPPRAAGRRQSARTRSRSTRFNCDVEQGSFTRNYASLESSR